MTIDAGTVQLRRVLQGTLGQTVAASKSTEKDSNYVPKSLGIQRSTSFGKILLVMCMTVAAPDGWLRAVATKQETLLPLGESAGSDGHAPTLWSFTPSSHTSPF